MADKTIYVIGVNGLENWDNRIYATLDMCSIVVGTQKTLSYVKTTYENSSRIERWIPIVPVESCLNQISSAPSETSIAVFTSGDPLFFGLGRSIIERCSDASIIFYPTLSSLQLCFARFGISWDDASFFSIHGRSMDQLMNHLGAEKLFILTDQQNSPAAIASFLSQKLSKEALSEYTIHVGEKLESPAERLVTGTIDDIINLSFEQPNCVILMKRKTHEPYETIRFGLGEKDIQHSRGLITKNEIRAAVIHALQIPDEGTFWDIGAGSGSISIEIARLFPRLSVYSIDHSDEAMLNIRANRDRYRCWNLNSIQGTAPESLRELPEPDRVFVGGSGGNLQAILGHLASHTPATCQVVVTGVIPQTYENAPRFLHELGYRVDVSEIKTHRYNYPSKERIDLNPIHIIRGTRT